MRKFCVNFELEILYTCNVYFLFNIVLDTDLMPHIGHWVVDDSSGETDCTTVSYIAKPSNQVAYTNTCENFKQSMNNVRSYKPDAVVTPLRKAAS